MLNDNDILKEFINAKNKINSNKIRRSWLNKNIKFKIFLTNRYSDIPSTLFSYKEVIWRIKNNIDSRPVCKICGEPVEFIGKSNKKWNNGYKHFCKHCRTTSKAIEIIKTHRENTNIKKYGSKTPLNNSIIRNKITETNMKKYGVKNQFSRKDLQDKIKADRFHKTGYEYPIQNPSVRQKQHDTCVQRFGEESYAKTKGFKDLYKDKEFLNKFLEKKEFTLTKNKTHNKSKKEDLLFQILSELYPNTIRQYKSEEYPFSCDFYIHELNLYLEFHGSHYHNGCLFNEKYDLHALEKLQIKSMQSEKTPNQYSNIIETWTVRDVKKFKTASQNKINYLILYPKWSSDWNGLCYQYSKDNIDKNLYEGIQEDLKNILNKFINHSDVQLIYGEYRKIEL